MCFEKKPITDDIAKLDKNFAIESLHDRKDIVFYDAKKTPFELYGLYLGELDVFKRMPERVAEGVSEGVKKLNFNTAGGRVRFTTDSDFIAIRCVMPTVRRMSHMALTGSSGFDLYETKKGVYTYIKTFVPPQNMTDGYESIIYLPDGKTRSFEINFPLYNMVSELYIGLRKGADVSRGEKYRYNKPILYYGSSVTQGGCASKPSNSYQAIISHRFDCDHINLGFSGNAKGETAIAEYIAAVDASVFVCDYDYNTPSVQHLKDTHLPLYKLYRKKNPNTPVIFVSAPVVNLTDEKRQSRQVISDTYNYALYKGDKNVCFIDGSTFFDDENKNIYTVDGTHPTDAGFLRMADVIGEQVGIMLSRKEL